MAGVPFGPGAPDPRSIDPLDVSAVHVLAETRQVIHRNAWQARRKFRSGRITLVGVIRIREILCFGCRFLAGVRSRGRAARIDRLDSLSCS